jgi:hypothetical protein
MLLFVSACADVPTALVHTVSEPRPNVAESPDSPHGPRYGATPYFCTGSRAVTGRSYRYQYGVRAVRFPLSELDPSGSTTVYHLVSYGGGGEIVHRASCMIPNTDAARARIARMFRAPPATLGGLRGKDADDGVVVQSVPLEGVDVTTCMYGGEPPHCNYAPPWIGDSDVQCPANDPSCGAGGGGDPDDWSWGGGGGDSPEPPSLDDGTDREPCKRDAIGNCVTEPVDSLELEQIVNKIREMKEYPQQCADAKRYGLELVSQGADRFRVWNGYDTYPDPTQPDGRGQTLGYNTSDSKGRILVFDSYWLYEEPTLVAHEVLHNYLYRINSPLIGAENEAFAEDWDDICN